MHNPEAAHPQPMKQLIRHGGVWHCPLRTVIFLLARKQIKPRVKVPGRHRCSMSIASCARVHDRIVAHARFAQRCFVGQSLSAEEDLHIFHCVTAALVSDRASIGMIKDLILEIADGPRVLCVKHADVPAG